MCLYLSNTPEKDKKRYLRNYKTKKVYKTLYIKQQISDGIIHYKLITPIINKSVKCNILKSRRQLMLTQNELNNKKVNYGIHTYIHQPIIICDRDILVECEALSEDCVAIEMSKYEAVFTKIKLKKIIRIGTSITKEILETVCPFLSIDIKGVTV